MSIIEAIVDFIFGYFLYVIDALTWSFSVMAGGYVPPEHDAKITHSIVSGVIFLGLSTIAYVKDLDPDGYPKKERAILVSILSGLIPALSYFMIVYIFTL